MSCGTKKYFPKKMIKFKLRIYFHLEFNSTVFLKKCIQMISMLARKPVYVVIEMHDWLISILWTSALKIQLKNSVPNLIAIWFFEDVSTLYSVSSMMKKFRISLLLA